MGFTDQRFAQIRPYVYHLTAQENLASIASALTLESAANLMRQADEEYFLRRKRPNSVNLTIRDRVVSIRDQQPLHAGNIRFQQGVKLGEFIRMLNERIFFWPGTANGPISYGERHYERYQEDNPVVLRVNTADLLAANRDIAPKYCRYNSGSPRCSRGLGSPRGPTTFVSAVDADFVPSAAVEITFADHVVLPDTVEQSRTVFGPWEPVCE